MNGKPKYNQKADASKLRNVCRNKKQQQQLESLGVINFSKQLFSSKLS